MNKPGQSKPTIKLFLFVFTFLFLSAALSVHAENKNAVASLTITAPGEGGAKLAEVNEFATDVLHDPWDMNEMSDLAYIRSESHIANGTFSNGVYSGQMNHGGGGERITLLTALAANHTALRVGKQGYAYPINADYYKYLTLRIYKGCSSCNGMVIEWFADDSYGNSVRGASNSFNMAYSTGWTTVVIPLHTIGIQAGSKNWSGTIRELIVHPYGGSGTVGSTVKLDWARLTPDDPNSSRPYTLQWTGGSGTYDIYASLDKTFSSDDILLKSGVNGSSGSTTLQTGILPAGTYYIAMRTTSGSVTWSPGPLIINDVPQIEILSPSMESGDDFAETVLGDAWDMESGDVNDEGKPWQITCTQGDSFVNGVFSANITACPSGWTYTDPVVYLGNMDIYPSGAGMDPVVDTSKYRYLVFRFYLEGQQNVPDGWVARFGWWQVAANDGTVNEDVVMSRDIILYEGWNTYKIDLWADDLIDEAHPIKRSWQASAPNRLRFDPAELGTWLTPANFQIDWVKLTAVEEINQGDSYLIRYDVQSSDDTTVTFYYDTDTNPAGRVPITSVPRASEPAATQPTQPEAANAANYTTYLPVIMNNYCSGSCLYWNTGTVTPSGATNNQYYICAEVSDGYNATYRCSETTITVK